MSILGAALHHVHPQITTWLVLKQATLLQAISVLQVIGALTLHQAFTLIKNLLPKSPVVAVKLEDKTQRARVTQRE